MVMEFVNGGELFFNLYQNPQIKEKKFSEDLARFYAAQMFLALEHMHDEGVIYRDFKPENIMID